MYIVTLVLLPKVPSLWFWLVWRNSGAFSHILYLAALESQNLKSQSQRQCGLSAEPRVSKVPDFWEAPRNSTLP